MAGLRFKAWISDEVTERWGAVYLWESREAADQKLPSRVRELIGKEPDIGEEFDVEATIEVGSHSRSYRAAASPSSSSLGTELSPAGADYPDTIESGRRLAVPRYRWPQRTSSSGKTVPSPKRSMRYGERSTDA